MSHKIEYYKSLEKIDPLLITKCKWSTILCLLQLAYMLDNLRSIPASWLLVPESCPPPIFCARLVSTLKSLCLNKNYDFVGSCFYSDFIFWAAHEWVVINSLCALFFVKFVILSCFFFVCVHLCVIVCCVLFDSYVCVVMLVCTLCVSLCVYVSRVEWPSI